MDRFADIEILRYRLPAFESLTLREKQFVRCLAEATLWGRDITTDQFCRHNLDIRRLTEAVWAWHKTREQECEEFQQLFTYLRRIWFANGIHHHYSGRKMLPQCSEEYFARLVRQVPDGLLPLHHGESIDDMLRRLLPVMFNPDVLPQRVSHDTNGDLVTASACNFYGDGVTEGEATEYYDARRREATPRYADQQPSWGLNTRLIKRDGNLTEETWRLGEMYSPYIERIVYWLTKALDFADSEQQRDVIKLLIDYYRTGDLATFDDYSQSWVKLTTSRVDFINGFIEVYGDPLGLKGSWEGIVHYRDEEATRRTATLCSEAQWFEDNSPVDARFKKREVRGVTAHVVNAAMLGGDEYPASAIGINLPNADWIRQHHGSKSITIANLTAALDAAAADSGFREEFIDEAATRQLIARYDALTDNLHTDLHECLGHGSGQLLPGVSPDALQAYASTIEEARADLFALYYMADPRMVSLRLLPDAQAYKAQYYSYMLNGLLTQCVRIPLGENIEEAHMRNRALIAGWIYRNGCDTLRLVTSEGKTYLRIDDYHRLRQLIARLLAEVQRIKSEGDKEAARQLVEEYGVRLSPTLHREMRERYSRLNIAPYKGFVNPRLTEVKDDDGHVIDIRADETETFTEQMMRYSRDYSLPQLR